MSNVPHSENQASGQESPGSVEVSASRTTVFDRRSEDEFAAHETVAAAQEIDFDSPEFYLNRELTWLAFNSRVLSMADEPDTPLLERVKFLAIISNNIDDFPICFRPVF